MNILFRILKWILLAIVVPPLSLVVTFFGAIFVQLGIWILATIIWLAQAVAGIIVVISFFIFVFYMVQPKIKTQEVTNLSTTTATLNGTINHLRDNRVVHCYFEFGKNENYEENSRNLSTRLSSEKPFDINITELEPATKYHYRAVLESSHTMDLTTIPDAPENSKIYGKDKTFVTLP